MYCDLNARPLTARVQELLDIGTDNVHTYVLYETRKKIAKNKRKNVHSMVVRV